MINTVFYLVLQLSSSIAVVPEPFTKLEQCQLAGLAWESKKTARTFECVKVESRLE